MVSSADGQQHSASADWPERFDLDEALAKMAGMQDIYLVALDTLRKDIPERLAKFDAAKVAQDFDQAVNLLHSFKGSALMVGGIGFADFCKRSEITLREQTDAATADMIGIALREQLEQLSRDLTAIKRQMSDA